MWREWLLFVALWWMPIGVSAQLERYDPDFGLWATQADGTLKKAKNFCDTIPLEVEDGQLFLRVVMGSRTYRFCLDTGSSQGMVYQGNNISGLQMLGNIVSHDANNHSDTVGVVQLPPFRLGSLTISGYVASIMPRQAISKKFDAIIGFDLFNRGISGKIDTERGMLVLTDQRKMFREEERKGHWVKYRLKWFVPYLYVSPFVRHTDEVLFDTGFNQLYTMNRESLEQHKSDDLARLNKQLGAGIDRQIEGRAEGQMSIGGFGAEQHAEVAFLHLDRLKWGDLALTDVRAITTEGASKMGAPLLNYGSVIINPWKKTITLLPHDSLLTGTNTISVGNKQFSVAFVPFRGQASVGLIFDQSEQYKAGMRQGDVILQIDQRPIPSFDAFLKYNFAKGENHRFRLRDKDGKEKTVVCKMTE